MPSKKAAKPGQLVIVDWLDAHADNCWTSLEDVEIKPAKVRSVGWVIKHDSKAITLCADGEQKKNPTKGDVNRTMVIPAGMIVRVTEIHL